MSHTSRSLQNSIARLSESVALLESSVDTLDDATRNVPRLKKILKLDKIFGLVPESDLIMAKTHLHNEVHPRINALVTKVDRELAKLARKKTNLATKVELLQVRLESSDKRSREPSKVSKSDDAKRERLNMLRTKRERIEYLLLRHNLQDRKARLSLIPSLPPQ